MAISYSTVNQKSLNNAVAKAKKLKPRVKVLGFNSFQVTGSKGDVYLCSFTKNNAGEFIGLCECQANRKNQICFHIVSVATLYKQQVFERAKARELALEQVTAAPTLPAADADQLARDHADLFGN